MRDREREGGGGGRGRGSNAIKFSSTASPIVQPVYMMNIQVKEHKTCAAAGGMDLLGVDNRHCIHTLETHRFVLCLPVAMRRSKQKRNAPPPPPFPLPNTKKSKEKEQTDR